MGPKGTLRAIQATERRLQREAQRRQRELARLEKEKAKLSAIEQAHLEVETYENQLEVLLSVHKEPCEQWDWEGLASALPPPSPKNYSHRELRARQFALVAYPNAQEASKLAIEQARAVDERYFEEARTFHTSETAAMEKMRELALRVLYGEHMAFIEAFAEFNPVAEISSVGSLKQFAVESKDLIECVFKVNANEVIPSQIKTLTANGKVSIKPMPRAQFHEIYQDYVCACVIRMAREVFAMLPVMTILVTALADVLDAETGQYSERPVLSVAMPRTTVANLDLDNLSAANAIEGFVHRGNFKVSRKAGAFQPIAPLTPADLRQTAMKEMDISEFHASIRGLRDAMRTETARASAPADTSAIHLGILP
ncbi:MAG: hypothetical protein ABR964_10525 [Tepidisphaeraceae bacterium]|jgi:hypothetical protein